MSANAPSAVEKPKVLILASQPAEFKSTVQYLTRRDYDVEICRSLHEALEAVALGQCQYLCLSLDFPNSRAEILPQVLEQNFNVAVIVFAEKHDKKTNSRLSSLRARNILFTQPSGPSLLAKVKQIWLPEKRKQQATSLETVTGEKFLTAKEAVEKLLQKLNRNVQVSEKQELKEKPFFELAPTVFERARTKRKPQIVEYDEYGNKVGARPQTFESKLQETVWDTADKSLQFVCPSKSKLGYMNGPIAEAELMCIDAMNFKGTFVVAYSSDEGSDEGSPLYAAESQLITDLKEKGFHIRDQDVTVLPMFDFDVPAKLINSAELVVTHSCRQFDISMGYFSSTKLIPLFEQTSEPVQMIDIGQFSAGSDVNVDVYLPLPLNKKFVRYWKRGTKVTEEQINKVVEHGTVQLGVDSSQLDLFSQYCAYEAIKAEVSKFEARRRKKAA